MIVSAILAALVLASAHARERIEPSNGACAFELDEQNAPPCCARWGFEKFGPGRHSWPFYWSSGCSGGMIFENDQEIIDWPNNQASACGAVGVCLSKGYYRKVEVEVESSNPSPPPPPRQRIEPSNGACAFELDAQNAPPCCAQWGFEKFGPGRLSWPFYKSSGCTGGMIFQNDQEIIDWPNNQAGACGFVGVCLSKGYYRKVEVEVESKGLRGGNISLE